MKDALISNLVDALHKSLRDLDAIVSDLGGAMDDYQYSAYRMMKRQIQEALNLEITPLIGEREINRIYYKIQDEDEDQLISCAKALNACIFEICNSSDLDPWLTAESIFKAFAIRRRLCEALNYSDGALPSIPNFTRPGVRYYYKKA